MKAKTFLASILGFVSLMATSFNVRADENDLESAVTKLMEDIGKDASLQKMQATYEEKLRSVVCAYVIEDNLGRFAQEEGSASAEGMLAAVQKPKNKAEKSASFDFCVSNYVKAYGDRKLSLKTIQAGRKAIVLAKSINREGRYRRNLIISYFQTLFQNALSTEPDTAVSMWKAILEVYKGLQVYAESDIKRENELRRRNGPVSVLPFNIPLFIDGKEIPTRDILKVPMPDGVLDWFYETITHGTYIGIPVLAGGGGFVRARELGVKPAQRAWELFRAGEIKQGSSALSVYGERVAGMKAFSGGAKALGWLRSMFTGMGKILNSVRGRSSVDASQALVALSRDIPEAEMQAALRQATLMESASAQAQRFETSKRARFIMKYTEGWRFWATNFTVTGFLEGVWLYYRNHVFIPNFHVVAAMTKLDNAEADWAYQHRENLDLYVKDLNEVPLPVAQQWREIAKSDLKHIAETTAALEFLAQSISEFRKPLSETIAMDRAEVVTLANRLISEVDRKELAFKASAAAGEKSPVPVEIRSLARDFFQSGSSTIEPFSSIFYSMGYAFMNYPEGSERDALVEKLRAFEAQQTRVSEQKAFQDELKKNELTDVTVELPGQTPKVMTLEEFENYAAYGIESKDGAKNDEAKKK